MGEVLPHTKRLNMKSKVTFNKSGSGSTSGRVTIPVAFLEALEITENDRNIEIKLIDNKIVIEKIENLEAEKR